MLRVVRPRNYLMVVLPPVVVTVVMVRVQQVRPGRRRKLELEELLRLPQLVRRRTEPGGRSRVTTCERHHHQAQDQEQGQHRHADDNDLGHGG